jgi:hypothetical protein
MFGIETVITRLTEIRDIDRQALEISKQWRTEDIERIEQEWEKIQAQWKRQEEQEAKAETYRQHLHDEVMTTMQHQVEKIEAEYQAYYARLQEQAVQPIDKKAIHDEVERERKAAARANKKNKVEEVVSNG